MKSDAFKAAVEAEDPEALTEALAEDVVFRSPVVFGHTRESRSSRRSSPRAR